MSDNSSRLQIIGRKGIIESSGVLHLDEDFVQRSLAILPIADSIFLLHPQFYE